MDLIDKITDIINKSELIEPIVDIHYDGENVAGSITSA